MKRGSYYHISRAFAHSFRQNIHWIHPKLCADICYALIQAWINTGHSFLNSWCFLAHDSTKSFYMFPDSLLIYFQLGEGILWFSPALINLWSYHKELPPSLTDHSLYFPWWTIPQIHIKFTVRYGSYGYSWAWLIVCHSALNLYCFLLIDWVVSSNLPSHCSSHWLQNW